MVQQFKHELDPSVVEQLTTLLRINLASAAGFMTAADNVGDPMLTDLFMTIAGERRLAAEQLARAMAVPVVRPTVHDPAILGVRRWWHDLRERVGNDRRGLLVDIEIGEKQVMDVYGKALRCTAGSTVNDLVQRHYDKVKSTHDQILILRNEVD